MTPSIISMHDIVARRDTFRFGSASLDVNPGYIVAVVGPNGSGKSTMFSTLMDLIRPEQGHLRLFGQTYEEAGVAIRRRIGFVPERTVGLERMTSAEMGSFASRWYPQWDMTRFYELLGVMEIDPTQQFRRLSKGLRRRLSSALALSAGADLLLADEPMDAVDPFFSEQMLERYIDFMMDGERAVVFSTHVLDDVRRIADYIVLINDGCLIGMFEKDALLECWRVLWVDSAPDAGTPGIVRIGEGPMARVLTQDVDEAAAALQAQGRRVIRSATPELGEILGTLLARHGREGVVVR